MACEINIKDIPISATAPAATDLVMMHLPDGTTICRTWGTLQGLSHPDDVEIAVALSGGQINNGATNYTLPVGWEGKRLRFSRGRIKQSMAAGEYTWNDSTRVVTFVPAAATDELFQFEAY